LLVLVDTPPGTAAALAEDLRSAIAGRAWEDLTGDLPVTASIGVTTGTGSADQTPAALLGHADALLYRAKERGRDRVVTDA
jgi:diguanylate cyclase (GGDEF)-like protein